MNPLAITGALKAVPKWVWYVLALIVLYFILRNPIKRAWQRFTATDRGDYSGQGLSATDEARLRVLANELHQAIDGMPDYDRATVLARAVDLSDTQLRFLAEEYEANGSNSLYTDLDDEYFIGDIGDQLLQRLRTIGMM